MTVQNPPIFLQAGSHPAEDVRRLFYAQMGGRPGIVGSGDLVVTENGTPNMSVNVAGGQAFIAGDEGSYQGLYFVENRGTTNLVISAANPTNPRKDLIVARVKDSAYSGATDAWELAVITGTPAGSPSEPTVTDNTLVLAVVDVPASDTSITNSQITDRRTTQTGQYGRAAALGGVVVCTSTTRPTVGVYAGMQIYETDTKRLRVYDGDSWEVYGDVGARVSWTPGVVQPGAIAGVIIYGSTSYKIVDNICHAWFHLQCGANQGIAGNLLAMDIPVATSWSIVGGEIVGNASIYDWSTGVRYSCDIEIGTFGGSTRLAFVGDWSIGQAWGQTPSLAFQTNDLLKGQISYPLL